MKYAPPSLESVQSSIRIMDKKYGSGEHKSIAALIKVLGDNCTFPDINIYLGIVVFGIKKIKSPLAFGLMNLQSPPKVTLLGGIINYGSMLARMLQGTLAITEKNPLGSDSELIYLEALRQYLQKLPDNIALPGYNNKQLLIADIDNLLIPLANQQVVNDLLSGMPSEQALKKDFAEIPQRYRTLKHNLHTSSGAERLNAIDFLEFLNKVCIEENADEKLAACKNKNGFPDNRSTGYQVRYGALLLIMAQIESEYTFKSELYRYCQAATLVNHSCDVVTRKEYYLSLFKFTQTISEHLQKMPESNTDSASNKITKIHVEKILTLFTETALNEYLKELRADPNSTRQAISNIVNFGTRCGVNIVITAAVCTIVPVPTAGALGISAFCSWLGNNYYGLAGKIIGNQFGTAAEQAITTGVVRSVVSYPLQDTLQGAFGNTAGNAAYYVASIPASLYSSVKSFVGKTKTENAFANPSCIAALLRLPDHIFSAEKKTTLHKIFIGPTNDVSETNEDEAHALMSANRQFA